MTRDAFQNLYRSVARGYAYAELEGGVGVYRLPSFSAYPSIDHGFSARTGGVSTGPFASLNLSYTRPEERSLVDANYRIFAGAAGIPFESMVMDAYEHGTTVRTVDRTDCGKGYLRDSLPPCDGLVTDDPAVTLITGHADCMAFFFYDPVKQAIGLCHAGWRGAMAKIGVEVVRAMAASFGCNPADIRAGLGPSICPRCFEVGDDVAELFEQTFPDCPLRGVNARGRATIDLWQVAVSQFLEGGVLPEHIELMGVCTFEDERLFSHRRQKGRTGGMAAYMRLLPEKRSENRP